MGEYKWQWQRLFRDLKKDTVEFFTNLYENIVEIYTHTFIYFPRNLYHFIKRVCQLAPIIWYDRDYDWAPMMYYLKFKIQKTADHIEEHNHIVNAPKYVKQMRKAVELIDLAIDDHHYYEECEKPVIEKYGRTVWLTECQTMNPEWVTKRNFSSLISRREKWTPELDKEINKANRAYMKKAQKMHERDWNKLFDHLAKYMRHWWD